MAVLIAPFGLACISFIFYLFIKGRHAERMSIIERGLDASNLNLGEAVKWTVLRAGMLMMGMGCGFVIGSVLNFGDIGTAGAMIGMSLLLGGLALILNFWVENKWRKK